MSVEVFVAIFWVVLIFIALAFAIKPLAWVLCYLLEFLCKVFSKIGLPLLYTASIFIPIAIIALFVSIGEKL